MLSKHAGPGSTPSEAETLHRSPELHGTRDALRHTGGVHPAFLYLPGRRLTLSELSAARIDGHVIESGEGYIPADLVGGAHVRAASIAELVPRDTAASGASAAWIHGAGDTPPVMHHVRRAVPHRIRVAVEGRVKLHDTAIPTAELVQLGGILVMSPARTMLDLALSLHRDESARRWMVLLAEVDARLVREAFTALSALHRVPGKRAAQGALERLRVRSR